MTDFEMNLDNEVDSEEEVIHYALLVDAEPVNINESLKKEV